MNQAGLEPGKRREEYNEKFLSLTLGPGFIKVLEHRLQVKPSDRFWVSDKEMPVMQDLRIEAKAVRIRRSPEEWVRSTA